MKSEIKLIGEIGFKDVKVKVYKDPYSKDDTISCIWRMRNPESLLIPIQTDEDKEMLPQFIITGCDKIDDKFISLTNSYFIKEYKRRNPKHMWRESQINIIIN